MYVKISVVNGIFKHLNGIWRFLCKWAEQAIIEFNVNIYKPLNHRMMIALFLVNSQEEISDALYN